MVMPAITSASYAPNRLHKTPLSNSEPDPKPFCKYTESLALGKLTGGICFLLSRSSTKYEQFLDFSSNGFAPNVAGSCNKSNLPRLRGSPQWDFNLPEGEK
jgi:hypothetical protein